jgi:hypothetical protein
VVHLPRKKKYESKEGGVQCVVHVETEVPVVRLPQKKKATRQPESPAREFFWAELSKAEEQYLPLVSAGMEIRERNSVL